MTNSHTQKSVPSKPLIVGTICGVLSCATLIFLSAFLITKSGSTPDNFITALMITLTGAGTFVGGYVSGKISREKGMLYGISCGFVMFVLFFLGGFAASRNSVSMLTAIRLITMLFAGSIGGIMGVNKT